MWLSDNFFSIDFGLVDMLFLMLGILSIEATLRTANTTFFETFGGGHVGQWYLLGIREILTAYKKLFCDLTILCIRAAGAVRLVFSNLLVLLCRERHRDLEIVKKLGLPIGVVPPRFVYWRRNAIPRLRMISLALAICPALLFAWRKRQCDLEMLMAAAIPLGVAPSIADYFWHEMHRR